MEYKVLHVDDDQGWLEYIVEIIESLGKAIEIIQKDTLEDALAVINEEGPNLHAVITDGSLSFNRVEGIEIAKAAVKAGIQRVAILSTSRTFEDIEGVSILNKSDNLFERIPSLLA